MWPPPGSFPQPIGGEAQGEFVEEHGVVAARAGQGEATVGPVELVEPQVPELLGTEGVDGDEGDGELRGAGGRLVDQAAQPVRGQRRGQTLGVGQAHASGGVMEDQPFAFECSEQGPQADVQASRRPAGAFLEGGLDVVRGDGAQAVDPLAPLVQDGGDVAEVAADRSPAHHG